MMERQRTIGNINFRWPCSFFSQFSITKASGVRTHAISTHIIEKLTMRVGVDRFHELPLFPATTTNYQLERRRNGTSRAMENFYL